MQLAPAAMVTVADVAETLLQLPAHVYVVPPVAVSKTVDMSGNCAEQSIVDVVAAKLQLIPAGELVTVAAAVEAPRTITTDNVSFVGGVVVPPHAGFVGLAVHRSVPCRFTVAVAPPADVVNLQVAVVCGGL